MPDCRCRECFGLAEYMHGLTGREYGLPAAPSHGHITLPLGTEKPCEGSMTCPCKRCDADREARVRRIHKPAKQPWDIRRAA